MDSGGPRFVGASYFGLGQDGKQRAAPYLRDYYGAASPYTQHLVDAVLDTPEAVRAALVEFAAAGADEVMPWPCIAELEQVELLAAAVAELA